MNEIDKLYDDLFPFGLPLGVTGSFALGKQDLGVGSSDIDIFMIGSRPQIISTILNTRFREMFPEHVINDDVLRAINNGDFDVFCVKGKIDEREMNMELYSQDLIERMYRFDTFWISRFRTRVNGPYKMMPYRSHNETIYSPVFHFPRYGAYDTKLLSLIRLRGKTYISIHYDKLLKAIFLIDNGISNLIENMKNNIAAENNHIDLESVFYNKSKDEYKNHNNSNLFERNAEIYQL